MKWETDFTKLPKLTGSNRCSKTYLCTTSNGNVVDCDWVKTVVRKNIVHRWERQGRICTWEIIAFMELPEPYVKEEIKIAVYKKYNGHCAYCGKSIDIKDMQVDHINPKRNGGQDTYENYNPSCRRCNHYLGSGSI